MRGVQKNAINRAQGETLFEFNCTNDQKTASCREAGCSLGYKGKSCLLSAAEIMYRWYPL